MTKLEHFMDLSATPAVIGGCLVFATKAAHEFFRFDPIKVTKADLKLFGRYPLGTHVYEFKLFAGDMIYSMFTDKCANVFALSTLLGCPLHGDIREVPLGRPRKTLDKWFKEKAIGC